VRSSTQDAIRQPAADLLRLFDPELARDLSVGYLAIPQPRPGRLPAGRQPPTYARLLPRQRPGPDGGSVEAPVQTVLRLLVPRSGTTGGRSVVVFERPSETTTAQDGSFRGILARELVRQTVLLAAREELGLLTRDLALRETFPSAPTHEEKVRLILRSQLVPGGESRISLHRGDGATAEILWKMDLTLAPGDGVAYGLLAEVLERLARTEIPQTLTAAGFPARPAQRPGETSIPETVRQRLQDLNLFDQFAALRELHAVADSPRRTGALVCGYAQLALLVEHHWTPVAKICKARALLYAQRLVATSPQAPASLWHRAYARALAGLPGDGQFHALVAAAFSERFGARGLLSPERPGPGRRALPLRDRR
jgi:hypothetical protein